MKEENKPKAPDPLPKYIPTRKKKKQNPSIRYPKGEKVKKKKVNTGLKKSLCLTVDGEGGKGGTLDYVSDTAKKKKGRGRPLKMQ